LHGESRFIHAKTKKRKAMNRHRIQRPCAGEGSTARTSSCQGEQAHQTQSSHTKQIVIIRRIDHSKLKSAISSKTHKNKQNAINEQHRQLAQNLTITRLVGRGVASAVLVKRLYLTIVIYAI
jgi:hypothetical protein